MGCSDDFFISPQTYNRLCFSKEFYEQFSEYEYMLLCQLDVFVLFSRNALPILQAIYSEGYPTSNPNNILLFDKSDIKKLASDLKAIDAPKLLIYEEDDCSLIEELTENNLVYGKDYISFWREYIKYEWDLMRKI